MRFSFVDSVFRKCGSTLVSDNLENLEWDFHVEFAAQISSGWFSADTYRVLCHGRSTKHGHDACSDYFRGVIDNAYVFKCISGSTFLLTMPLNTPECFYAEFDAMMSSFYKESGIRDEGRIRAVVVHDRYKIRTNGDIVAVIATDDVLRELNLAGT